MADRDVVFISHANPEDNEFARWLALKLTSIGYHAWSDVTRLLGGEDFWARIEDVIRNRSAKLLFVLSRASNHKPGTLNELHIAQGVARKASLGDFVIPLRIDDLPHSEMNIQLARLNTIDFSTGWASGLKSLAAKLHEDSVPTSSALGPAAVRAWWREACDVVAGVSPEPERHVSNWFSLQLPDAILLHTLTRDTIGLVEPPKHLPRPAYWHAGRLVSFAAQEEFAGALGSLRVQETESVATPTFLSSDDFAIQKVHRDIVTHLASDAWERTVLARGLKHFQMAGGRRAFYFDADSLPKEDVTFVGADGEKTRRSLRGYRTVAGQKRYWHFGVSARPTIHPEPMLMLRCHVFFSDDARVLWSSPSRAHRARRSQCRDWWNDTWRDRLLATVSWIADGQEQVSLSLSRMAQGGVSIRPLEFISPVCLHEPAKEPDLVDESDESDDADEAMEDD